MLEGLYAAAAGMEAQQTQLDAVANDLANSDTPGYQATEIGFHDLLYGSDNVPGTRVGVGAGAAATTIGYSQAQGPTQQTGNPLDVAIIGDAYLEVRQPDGTIGLTRNGTLQVNAAGQLTTSLGMPIEPRITLPKGTSPGAVKIAPDGVVSVGSARIGKLSLVTVPAPDQLVQAGNGVFTASVASGGIRPATGATVQQGALEQSNVDANTELTAMLATQQSYELASKAMGFETQMAQIAATLKTA